jgi:hypothetical protein
MVRPTWWADWTFSRYNDDLSILDVVNSGTLDWKLAGLLWLLMEHRASVLVAAGPIFAGKTTILHSLLDFLPPGTKRFSLRGYAETFDFTDHFSPDITYLVSEEISNHQFEYLWGHQVVKALELLSKGYGLGATIHARNVQEVAYVLHSYLNVPLPLIARLGAVVTLQVTQGQSFYDEPIRRIDTLSIINMDDKNLIAHTLAARESFDGEFVYPSDRALQEALSRKFGVKYEHVLSEVTRRETFLRQLGDISTRSREEVKKAISDYYKSQSL